MYLILLHTIPAGRPNYSGLPPKSPQEMKGVEGFHRSEMAKMSDTSPVYVPPVHLESFTEFKKIARDAAVVVFSPEYLRSPFLDDEKRLRRLTVAAIGVKRNDVPLTFKFTISHESALERYHELDPSTAMTRFAALIREEIEYFGNVVQGTVESEATFGELLEARP
jgi:hypothetical protein